MKKVFTRILLCSIVAVFIYSCDNGNADITILDSAPDIALTNVPEGVVSGTDIKAAVDATDGAFESSSLSPIASVRYTLTDTVSTEEILAEVVSGSGRSVKDTITISTSDLAISTFKLEVVAIDTEGFTASAEAVFSVAEDFTIGLIGSATAGGFDAETPMERDESNFDLWTISSIDLTAGAVKFRKNNSWDVNWGGSDFPVGVAEPGTFDNNIPVSEGGEYRVTFNSSTLEYSFTQLSGIPPVVSIIGSATPGGWGADTNMELVEGSEEEYVINSVELTSTEGLNPDDVGVKFRQDNAWDVNWGSDVFPTGTATLSGPNIQIPTTGMYKITFNRTTGEFNFELL